MRGRTDAPDGRRAETAEVSAPALSRLSLALGAALALHIGAMSLGQTTARDDGPLLPPRTMTVRTITPVAVPTASKTSGEATPVPPPPVPEATPAPVPAHVDIKPVEAAPGPSPSPAPSATALAPLPPMAAAAPVVADARTPVPPPSATAALPAAPQYLMAARLDPGPQPIGDIEPVYPESAHLQEGTVVLRVLISETGRVDNVAVARSNPKGYFEEAAIEAFAKAEFTPGRAAGVAVKSQITVEVHFLPINRGRISGRGY